MSARKLFAQKVLKFLVHRCYSTLIVLSRRTSGSSLQQWPDSSLTNPHAANRDKWVNSFRDEIQKEAQHGEEIAIEMAAERRGKISVSSELNLPQHIRNAVKLTSH